MPQHPFGASSSLLLAIVIGLSVLASCAAPSSRSRAPTLRQITVDGDTSALMAVGQRALFAAKGTFADGTTQDVTNLSLWSVSNPAVISVNATSGVAFAVGTGTSQVTATYAGISGSKTVTLQITIDGDWSYLGTVFTTQLDTTVRYVVVDPRDDQVMYVTTDNGEFASINRGATWTAGPALRSNDPYTGSLPVGLRVDPRNPDRVFFARGQTLWMTADRGQSWTAAFDVPPSAGAKAISNFLISRIDDAMFVLTSFSIGGKSAVSDFDAYRSLDHGATWTRASFNDPRFLLPWDMAEDALDGTLYVPTEISNHPQPYDPPWYRSTDRGQTWQLLTKPVAWHALSVITDPDSHRLNILTEGAGLYRSDTHGDTWTTLGNLTFFGQLIHDPNSALRFFAGTGYFGSSPGGVLMSLDDGQTFTPFGLQGLNCANIALESQSRRLYASCYHSGIWMINLTK